MADRDHLILTAVGPDQVGLVQRLSEFISRHACNIEDSKMAVFCGEFAIILLITGESSSLFKIANGYRELESQTGLTISIKTPSRRKPTEPHISYRLVASCMDHPGLVYQLSEILSSSGVNIESMETKTYAAPDSGTPIFCLEAKLSVPTEANLSAVRERFAEIQRLENIDIELALA
jgi:glycine cleavage system transcriptional repressor